MELLARLSLPILALTMLGFGFLVWSLPFKRDSEPEAEQLDELR